MRKMAIEDRSARRQIHGWTLWIIVNIFGEPIPHSDGLELEEFEGTLGEFRRACLARAMTSATMRVSLPLAKGLSFLAR